MTGENYINQKKNLLYCTERDRAQLVKNARVAAWADKMPWYCTAQKRIAAIIRPGMRLSYTPGGDYQVDYIQDVDPELRRMRWTCRFTGLNAGGEKLFDFIVDTRELTVHPVTKSWVYQIHTGSEVAISRHFDEIASWERDLGGNGWFKTE